MTTEASSEDIPLPRSWPGTVRSAILQVGSPSHIGIILPSSIAVAGLQEWPGFTQPDRPGALLAALGLCRCALELPAGAEDFMRGDDTPGKAR